MSEAVTDGEDLPEVVSDVENTIDDFLSILYDRLGARGLERVLSDKMRQLRAPMFDNGLKHSLRTSFSGTF